jgi:SAM-dependent methyltransferase
MNDWTGGYVSELDYFFGYYAELNPLRARLALLDGSFSVPRIETACELGFGQGVSLAVHAAASDTAWWGTDFNPAHAAHARDLAQAADAPAVLSDEAFGEFCTRSDLPDFDFIGLHGVWSWISDENRGVIVEFLKRKLKPGGLVYISYNTLPGHAAMVPLRQLMVRHAEAMQAGGLGLAARIDGALDFAGRMLGQETAFATAHPYMAERLRRLKEDGRAYLAHEYFNRDWRPMLFCEAADHLSHAKLTYASSASYPDHVDAVNLTPGQQAFLGELADPTFRQSVRDFLVNQSFRRDYWIKGPRRLSASDQSQALRRERFVLITPREAVSMTAPGVLSDVALKEDAYLPVLDLMADHRTRSFAEIEQAVGGGDALSRTLQAIVILIGKGDLAPARDEAAASLLRDRTDRLNGRIMAEARSVQKIQVLASPVTAGGTPVSRFEQLFLQSRQAGGRTPEAWAASAWSALAAQNELVLRDGVALQTPEENLAELAAQARTFSETRLPVLQALMIA